MDESMYDANTWTEDETAWHWSCAVSLLCSAELGDVLAAGVGEASAAEHSEFTGPGVSFELWVGRPVQMMMAFLIDRRQNMKVKSLRRMGAGGVAARTTDAVTVNTVVRRLGYIAVKVHETVMANLIHGGNAETAEQFNDIFKPLCDALLNFELDVSRETEDDDGNASTEL